MTALQSKVLPKHAESLFMEQINSLSLLTDPSAIFSVMGDGATSKRGASTSFSGRRLIKAASACWVLSPS